MRFFTGSGLHWLVFVCFVSLSEGQFPGGTCPNDALGTCSPGHDIPDANTPDVGDFLQKRVNVEAVESDIEDENGELRDASLEEFESQDNEHVEAIESDIEDEHGELRDASLEEFESQDNESYTLLGCYNDQETRDLSFFMGSPLSLDECADKCKDYNFFGMEGKVSAGECRCGNTYGMYGPAEGCDCAAGGDIPWWKQCIYHKPTPCTGGLTIPNSDRTQDAPCQGADGDTCEYKCDEGYMAVGRHVCQTYNVSGKNFIDHAFFGGRCDKLCTSEIGDANESNVPVRIPFSEDGEDCLQTTWMEPNAAFRQLARGGYQLFQMGRNPRTGIYIDHVDVKKPADQQWFDYASIDATSVGLAAECVAAAAGIAPLVDAQANVLTTLRALTGRIDGFEVPRNPYGFWPTYIHSDTGVEYGDDFASESTGMIGAGSLFVKTCFGNLDPDSDATQEISALVDELNDAIQYEKMLCDDGTVDGEGDAIPYQYDNGTKCWNVLTPGPDGYYYYNEMFWIVSLAFHRACGGQPEGECSDKPIERMWAAWQGRRLHPWYYYGGRGILTLWPSFLLQLPFYLVHDFNSDSVYNELFKVQWQSEWDYYKTNFNAGEDGRYGNGAGPTMQWCAGTTYLATTLSNWTNGSQQHCRMYSPYAVAGYLPAAPDTIKGHLLALLSSGDATYRLVDSDLFVLWRKSLLNASWAQQDWGMTLVDFASEFYGLSTIWLGADFFRRSTNHWPDENPPLASTTTGLTEVF